MSGRPFAVFLLTGVLLAGGLWLQYTTHFDARDGKARVAQIRDDIAYHENLNRSLASENDFARARLHDLKNNPAHIEELARKWLFMIKQDEVFVLPVPAEE